MTNRSEEGDLWANLDHSIDGSTDFGQDPTLESNDLPSDIQSGSTTVITPEPSNPNPGSTSEATPNQTLIEMVKSAHAGQSFYSDFTTTGRYGDHVIGGAPCPTGYTLLRLLTDCTTENAAGLFSTNQNKIGLPLASIKIWTT